MRFEGKRVLVTGAASGIGRATAVLMANEGAELFIADVNKDGLSETAELAAGSPTIIVYDASNTESCKELIAEVTQDGGLDILCNIAGVLDWGPTLDFDDERFDRIMRINLSGTFALNRAVLPHLIESKGNIVNMASAAALQGVAYTAAYAASKHGVAGITKSLAVEFADRGVRVNAVCPGHVNTPMGNKAPPEGDIVWEKVMRNAPKLIDGTCEPEDIAEMVAYLASDKARKVTGSLFTIDGGQLAG